MGKGDGVTQSPLTEGRAFVDSENGQRYVVVNGKAVIDNSHLLAQSPSKPVSFHAARAADALELERKKRAQPKREPVYIEVNGVKVLDNSALLFPSSAPLPTEPAADESLLVNHLSLPEAANTAYIPGTEVQHIVQMAASAPITTEQSK